MHACAHSTTLQVGPHWAATYFFEVAKAADVCSTLRIHNQCECCTSAEFAGCHPKFFLQHMAFGIRCKESALSESGSPPLSLSLLRLPPRPSPPRHNGNVLL